MQLEGKENNMNILVAVNDAYVQPLAVMLTSLLENNKNVYIQIYLLFSDVSKTNIRKLDRLVKRYSAEFNPIKIKSDFLDNVPINGFAKETYFRLFAFKFLPEKLDKILFLDPDMIIDGSLEDMYNTYMSEDIMYCAVPDTSNGIDEVKRRLRIPDGGNYYNSGTLLMNLETIRKKFDEEKVIDYAVKHNIMLYYCDQDLLNVFYRNRIYPIERKYNYEARFLNNIDFIKYFLRKEKPIIIHYMGAEKPWKKGYSGKYQNKFYKYSKIAGIPLMRRYSQYNKKMYLINYIKGNRV